MEKLSCLIKKYWLLIIIVAQPIIDILSYFLKDTIFFKVSLIIRSLFLVFIVVYTFFHVDKKKLITYISPFAIFSIIHTLNSYLHGSYSIFSDLKYLIMVFQMPILVITLILYIKNNKELIKTIESGLIINYIIIFVTVLLSIIFNNYVYTYYGYGVTGWFNSSNTQSMILAALTPLFVLYTNKKDNSTTMFIISLIMSFIMLYINGTRACYYELVCLGIVYLYLALFNKKEKVLRVIVSMVYIFLSLFLYEDSFTNLRRDDVKNVTNRYASETNINCKKYYDGATFIRSESCSKDEKCKEENACILSNLKNSSLYFELIEKYGAEKIIETIGDDYDLIILSDNRYKKRLNARIIFEESDLTTKLFGIDYSYISIDSNDLENDFSAIFYYYGYVGFVLYASFILYFAFIFLKYLLKNKKLMIDPSFVIMCATIVLLLYGGEYSGAFFRKPNANIYFSFILVLVYFFTDKKELVKDKISFISLHLGYGGIESSVINTANSLSDKYNVEIVSLYKVKNNQSSRINKNIKVIYLYNKEPNKKEFLDAFHKRNIIKIITEGIKSIFILNVKYHRVKRFIINSNSKFIISTRIEFNTILSDYGREDTIKIAQEHCYRTDKLYIHSLKQLNNIDYLCALSEDLKKMYSKILKHNRYTKIILLPNMLNEIPDKKSDLKNKNIISVSRIDKNKSIDDLIKIVNNVKDFNKFYIIGDGDELVNIKKQVKELGLEKKVIITGFLNKKEIEKYMLDSSVFVMASKSEALPVALLEACSYGLPCIAFETFSGTKDIIHNNKNGYIIKPLNYDDFEKKLTTILKDGKIRKDFSKESLLIANKYTKEEILKIWYNIFDK